MLGATSDNEITTMSTSSGVISGSIRNYDATNNTGSGHSSSTTTWTDLTGTNNGTISGATWSDQYLSLDGTDDWVNLGQVSLSNAATLEATIELKTIQAGEVYIRETVRMEE